MSYEHSIKKIFIDKKNIEIIKTFEKICNLAVSFFDENEEKTKKEIN